MQIWNADPFVLTMAPLVQKVAPRRAFATFMVKATYRITHDHPPFPLSEPDITLPRALRYMAGELKQDLRPDLPTPDVPDPEVPGGARSLCDVPPLVNLVEGDTAPFKPAADVIVVADAHAPGGVPVSALEVGLAVGSRLKTLLVSGDHYWVDGRLTPFQKFTSMPISYTRAYGGPDWPRNPVGKGHRAETDTRGRRVAALPNIVYPGQAVGRPEAKVDPAGFGPLSRFWPQRSEGKAGTYDDAWLKTRHPWFPADFDWSIYNCAPPDQQFPGYLRGDEALAFKNLHPRHPVYRFSLPGIRPRVFFKELLERTAGVVPPAAGKPEPAAAEPKQAAAEPKPPRETGASASADPIAADPIAQASRRVAADLDAWTARLEALTAPISGPPLDLPVFDDPGPYRWREVSLNLDTVVVDLRAEKLTMVWRGLREIPSPRFEGITDLYVTHEDITAEPAAPEAHLAGLEAMKDLLRAALSEGMSDPEAVADEIERRVAEIPALVQAAQGFGRHMDGLAEKVDMTSASPPPGAGTRVKPPPPPKRGDGASPPPGAGTQVKPPPLPERFAHVKVGGDPKVRALEGLSPEDRALALADMRHLDDGGTPETLPSTLAVQQACKDIEAEITKQVAAAGAQLEAELGPMVGGKLLGDTFDTRERFVQAIRDGQDMRACTAIGLDLTNIDLSGLDFRNANFVKSMFTGSVLRNANLAHARFSFCGLARVDFSGADLTSTQFYRAKLAANRFVGCTLTRVNLIGHDLKAMDFSRSRGSQAYFLGADLSGGRFVGADLPFAVLAKGRLRGTDFTDARLERAVMMMVDATGAVFTRATLDHATMGVRSSYVAASFMNARLNRVNLDLADLRGADFGGAVMRSALVNEVDARRTVFEHADLAETYMEDARLAGALMVNANLLRASLTRSDLEGADLSGSNLYHAQFFDTHLKRTAVGGAFLKGSLLDGEQPLGAGRG